MNQTSVGVCNICGMPLEAIDEDTFFGWELSKFIVDDDGHDLIPMEYAHEGYLCNSCKASMMEQIKFYLTFDFNIGCEGAIDTILDSLRFAPATQSVWYNGKNLTIYFNDTTSVKERFMAIFGAGVAFARWSETRKESNHA